MRTNSSSAIAPGQESPGQPSDLQEELEERLLQLNRKLQNLGLRGFKKIRRYQDGCWEIVRFIEAWDFTYYKIVQLETRMPYTGEHRLYNMRFHADGLSRRAYLIIPIVNQRYLCLVRQARLMADILDDQTPDDLIGQVVSPMSGQFCWELPRQFPTNSLATIFSRAIRGQLSGIPIDGRIDQPKDIESLIGRELYGLVCQTNARFSGMRTLSREDLEDSGCSATAVQRVAIDLLIDKLDLSPVPHGCGFTVEGLKLDKGLKLKLCPVDQLLRDPYGAGIRDDHTLATLMFYQAYYRHHDSPPPP